MLTEETVIDQISVDEYGNTNVRTATRIIRDGATISETYHRRVIGPKDSLKDEDERVAAVARAGRKGAKAILTTE